MARNYYYLVAGLPDLVLEGNKHVPSLPEFIDDTMGQVDPDDAKLLALLRRPADNHNLLVLLEKRDEELDPLGNFSREELELGVRIPDELPSYMQTFVEAYREGRQIFAGYTSDDQLSWLFYDEVTAHPNSFIREWFTFELNLRNVLAGLNCRKMAGVEGSTYSFESNIIGRNEVAEHILKSNAPDFSLSSLFPWVEDVLAFDDKDPVGFENSVDTLRWDELNELTLFTYFRIETILAFCVKLGMVERWLKLDPETGKKKLDRLIEELVSGVQLSGEFS
ncbi:MAG: DUF2764 family protein [Chitinivibrionales bacterium]|nr:DUF2764 family protein [Chitinivibrionales bacterium]MBD3357772.1 DUF2764 family protein [Chitinivibrionales bacterium]